MHTRACLLYKSNTRACINCTRVAHKPCESAKFELNKKCGKVLGETSLFDDRLMLVYQLN